MQMHIIREGMILQGFWGDGRVSVCHLAFRLINGVLLFQLEKNKKPGLSLVINENTQQDPWDSSFRYVWVSYLETKRFANLKLFF